MTDRAKFEAEKRRLEQFIWADWRCLVCGESLHSGTPQLAHRVINSKHNEATIPPEVLHHPLNTLPVCSLRCNSAVIVHDQEAKELLSSIVRVVTGEEAIDFREYYQEVREGFYQSRHGPTR